jgi:hypothetical protein
MSTCRLGFSGFFLFAFISVIPSFAQENYEIQVYPSETIPKGTNMLEVHSNYTTNGRQLVENGMLPTHHIFHETIEITHGFNSWFETGLYFFNAIGSDNRTNYVGSHIRPRARVPERWHLPVGLSLSAEVGYQKLEYSEDDWNIEIRPIIDKTWRKLYISFNPVFGKALHGLNESAGFDFSPNLKISLEATKKIAFGIEYYGSVGDISTFDPYRYKEQQHQLFIVTDLDIDPDWEINAGYGFGAPETVDMGIIKLILGYRMHRHNKKQ